jgi:hypothetical protein
MTKFADKLMVNPSWTIIASRKLAPAGGQHRFPMGAKKPRFLQRFTRVLASGLGKIDARLDEHLVAVVGQGQDPRIGRDHFGIARRPQATTLRPDRIREDAKTRFSKARTAMPS